MPSAAHDPTTAPLEGLRIVSDPAAYRELIYTDLARQDPKIVSSPPRRRSVSSMKGLLPLALSPSATSTTQSLTEDEMGDTTDAYLPELLAQDLELATEVFAARKLTAGPPSTSLATDYRARVKATGNNIIRSIGPSPYHTASAKVQLLGAIEERESMASLFEHHEHASNDTSSELDSLDGSEESGGMPPPSFRYRNQSVATAATSLASSGWQPSLGISPAAAEAKDFSWIDRDSDGEQVESKPPDHHFAPLSPISPRLSSPSRFMPNGSPTKQLVDAAGAWSRKTVLHRKSHSVSGGSPLVSPIKPPASCTSDNFSYPSRQTRFHQDAFTPRVTRPQTSSPSQRPHLAAPPPHHQRRDIESPMRSNSVSFGDRRKSKLSINTDIQLYPGTSLQDTPDSTDDDSHLYTFRPMPTPQRETIYIRPTPPPSPLPSVQAWLNNSSPSCASPYHCGDDLSKLIPLPPEVIETLRVSIACFPETMLLSSSLTVDTIRTYSKKFRHPGMKIPEPMSFQAAPQTERRSLWRRVVPSRRPSQSSDYRQRTGYISTQSSLQSISAASLQAPKVWAPLKTVFGCCTDYICDALYAHLIAYNYISALVARSSSTLRPVRQPSSRRLRDGQKDDIPKKAASLLGLSGNSDPAPPKTGKLTKRPSSNFRPWSREESIANQPASSANHDNAVRGLQNGLLKCIARLISTARLMSESGTNEDRMVDMETEETDMLFMKSLCEIVKMSEETYP